jgi:hypothetical protein
LVNRSVEKKRRRRSKPCKTHLKRNRQPRRLSMKRERGNSLLRWRKRRKGLKTYNLTSQPTRRLSILPKNLKIDHP